MFDPKSPRKNPEEAIEPRDPPEQNQPEKPKKNDVFHPHRHGHVVIGVPSTGVSHIDPGVVTFS